MLEGAQFSLPRYRSSFWIFSLMMLAVQLPIDDMLIRSPEFALKIDHMPKPRKADQKKSRLVLDLDRYLP